MPSVLWAAIVHGADAPWLSEYLRAVNEQSVQPSRVIVIDSGRSEPVRRVVESQTRSIFEYCPLTENLGFNVGLNRAVDEAVSRGHDWLATMTVRAKPANSWLSGALHAGEVEGVGMVTTLHIDKHNRVDCFGHNLGLEGQLFSFAEGLNVRDIEKCQTGPLAIWSPCSGGALYRTEALASARELLGNPNLVRPRGFKLYNCDVLGYLIRASGYKNSFAFGAVCTRVRDGSSSKKPDTAGLLMNQEINRIANIFEFWQGHRMEHAISEYLRQDRHVSGLEPVDLRVARTLGEGFARPDVNNRVGVRIQTELDEHLGLFAELKARWKALLASRDAV